MYVSVPLKSQRDPVSLELHSITPLASVGLLHKVGWALGIDCADVHFHLLRQSIAVLK